MSTKKLDDAQIAVNRLQAAEQLFQHLGPSGVIEHLAAAFGDPNGAVRKAVAVLAFDVPGHQHGRGLGRVADVGTPETRPLARYLGMAPSTVTRAIDDERERRQAAGDSAGDNRAPSENDRKGR